MSKVKTPEPSPENLPEDLPTEDVRDQLDDLRDDLAAGADTTPPLSEGPEGTPLSEYMVSADMPEEPAPSDEPSPAPAPATPKEKEDEQQQTIMERIKNLPQGALLAIAGVTAAAWFFSKPQEDDGFFKSTLRTAVRYSGLAILGAWAWQKYGADLMTKAGASEPSDKDEPAKKPLSPYETPTEEGAPTEEVEEVPAAEPQLQQTGDGVYLWVDPAHAYKIELYGLNGESVANLVALEERGDSYVLTARKEFEIPGDPPGQKQEIDLPALVSKEEVQRVAAQLRDLGKSESLPVNIQIDTTLLPEDPIMVSAGILGGKKPSTVRENALSWLDGTLVKAFPGYKKISDTQFALQYSLFFRAAK